MRERRAFIRVPVALQTTYQPAEGMAAPKLGMSEDLSLGGMRLYHPEHLGPGRNVTVTFRLPKEGQVILRGTVIWSREVSNGRGGYLSGIKWMEIHAASQARLNAFLTDRTRPSSPVLTPSTTLPKPFLWWRVVGLALLGLFLVGLAASFWLESRKASIEIDSLKSTLYLYQDQFRPSPSR